VRRGSSAAGRGVFDAADDPRDECRVVVGRMLG